MVDILINIFPHDSETLDSFTNYFNIDTKNIEDMYEKTSKNINFIQYLSKEESYIYIKDECLGYIDMKLSSNKQEIEFTTNFGILTVPYNMPTYACFEDMKGRYISIRKYLQNDTMTFLNELLEEINERNPEYDCIKYKDIDKNFKEIYNFLQKNEEER